MTIAGTAATLARQFTVAADAGAFSVTGTAATLQTTRVLVADSGAVALTGTDASLRRGFVPLVAESGSVTAALKRQTVKNDLVMRISCRPVYTRLTMRAAPSREMVRSGIRKVNMAQAGQGS